MDPIPSAPPAAPPVARSTESSDADLVAGLQANEDAAYERLLREQGGQLLAVARRIMGTDADAADALQDAMMAVARHIKNSAGDCRLATWLHRITVNAALMRLRTRRRRPEESIEPLLPTFKEDGHHQRPISPWREHAADALVRTETAEIVRAAIQRLPDNYRVILMLRDIEQLDPDEVAHTLGITTNAVKVRLHRARQALRTLLDRHFGGATP